jgi:hypothetical protein
MSKRHIYFLVLGILLTIAKAAGQTDIGSQSSGGSVTGANDRAALTREQRFERQKAELQQDLAKIPPQVWGTGLNPDALIKAYQNLRQSGQDVSPLDFLATAKVIQQNPSQKTPSKKDEAIRNSLIDAGAASPPGGRPETEALLSKTQFEKNVKQAKLDLQTALQQK